MRAAINPATQDFIARIVPFGGIASDLDGTGYDSEWPASRVTAQLTIEAIRNSGGNPYSAISRLLSMQIDGDAALVDRFAEYVCMHYSGRAVEKQVPMIEGDLGIKLPETFVGTKKKRNIEVLGKETAAIDGYPELLQFALDHRVPFICLTASPPDRVEATKQSAGLNHYLTTSREDGKIPVISTKTPTTINFGGREIEVPAYQEKPHPHGYSHVADHILRANRKNVLALEDSRAGLESARDAGLHVGIVATGSHFPRDIDAYKEHVEALVKLVGHTRHLVVDNPRAWTKAVIICLALAMEGAREAGVLSAAEGNHLPSHVIDHVHKYFAHLAESNTKLRHRPSASRVHSPAPAHAAFPTG